MSQEQLDERDRVSTTELVRRALVVGLAVGVVTLAMWSLVENQLASSAMQSSGDGSLPRST